jgi:predicted ATPase/DNA-binding winged helix-turn-helix (wHTH) protein
VKDNIMIEPATPAKVVMSFGPFTLVPSERLLTREGVAVPLGARTLDTLMALVSVPNEVVSKRDLMARVWPDVTVEEGSLRFHIAELRKALGDGKGGARYITTLAGRGYCFVAPITRSSQPPDGPGLRSASFPRVNLPNRLPRMVGRADGVLALSAQLLTSRFVTIIGPGGVGKTTVAIAVAHDLLEAFAEAVIFVDLGALSEPDLVTTSLSLMLGLPVQSDDPTPGLVAHLRDRRMLLILDNCEHVIEAVASLVTKIFPAAPQIHILATSREALRVEGEQIYQLAPLAFPPDEPGLTAAIAVTYPATQLFLERAAASGAQIELSDSNLATVASICQKLDGMALAIELAASRVQAYGLQQTAALLDQRLSLLWQGQRTAPPRQKTLYATLDWSYGLLSEVERVVLHRLAVFVGYFTIEAALDIVTDANVDRAVLFGTIDSLVAKSMVAPRPIGAMIRYRLLGTTRTYLVETGVDDAGLAARHAIYYQRWLQQTGAEWPTLSNAAQRAPHFAGLHNVRAALEWCFGANGDTKIGIGLVAAAAPVFLAMSLLTECHRWSKRAIIGIDGATRGSAEEMHIQAALGLSLMFTLGNSELARVALNRSLAIAEERNDVPNQLQLLGRMHIFHERMGQFEPALRFARRSSLVSAALADPSAIAVSQSLLGVSLHLAGDHLGARTELEAAINCPERHRTTTVYGFDHHNRACITLARTLWLQGHPARAAELARQTVNEAAQMDHPVTLCIALIWAVSVFLWSGDLDSAEENIDRFITHAHSRSMGPYLAVGRGVKGELAIQRGDAKSGVESLKQCLEELHAARYELLTTPFNISLIHGLLATGRFDEGMSLIDETIRLVEANCDLVFMPELLRVKGNALLSLPQSASGEGERCFKNSLEWSRRQGALAWELRTTIDLAKLLTKQKRNEDARPLLRPVFERFESGSETVDLKIASELLAVLERRS